MNMPDASTSPMGFGGSLASSESKLQPGPTLDQLKLFDEFEHYHFSDDPDFKAGLPTVINALRGMKKSAAQIDEMISRAQWFYFTRLKNVSLPWETYASYSTSTSVHSLAPSPTPSSSSPSASSQSRSPTPLHARPRDALAQLNSLAEARKMMTELGGSQSSSGGESGMSFAMLCRLISEGRAEEVTGVRNIPDQLNPFPSSDSTMTARPKPWEQTRPQMPVSARSSPPQGSSPYAPFIPSPPSSAPPQPTHHSPVDVHSMQQQLQQPSPPQIDTSQTLPKNTLRPSPPGTSASFSNPPLAPSPGVLPSPMGGPFDFAQLGIPTPGEGGISSFPFPSPGGLDMTSPSGFPNFSFGNMGSFNFNMDDTQKEDESMGEHKQ